MSFADNLAYLRQHYNLTQEMLAEKLEVSRQTVSKWEAGINYPETEKMLMLCDMFKVNLDNLMRGKVVVHDKEETKLYDSHMNSFSRNIICGIIIGTGGISALLLLDYLGAPQNISPALLLTLFLIAGLIFAVTGLNHSRFKHRHPQIEPSYEEEELERFARRFPALIAIGIGIAALGIIQMVALSPGSSQNIAADAADSNILLASIMLILFGCGGALCAYAGIQNSKYERDRKSTRAGIIKMEDSNNQVSPRELKRRHITESVCGAIMILAVIAFLALGFAGSVAQPPEFLGGLFESLPWLANTGWAYSWIAFVVGGMLCGIASLIINMLFSSEEELLARAKEENPWITVKDLNESGPSTKNVD